ncbi:MAG: HD family hydrolase [Caulobacterales bacterium]|nr:HD family hydrolase [Caulobacterales bacterium]
MLSGRRLDLLDPSPLDVEISDIAHGLARVARWNGQTAGAHAFSVAQHSLVVEDLAGRLAPALSPAERLLALLHDAPEYVVGDMISPFKAALGVDYRDFEDRLARAIHIRFALPASPAKPLAKLIKQADRLSAYFEAVQIAGFTEGEARQFFGEPPDGLHVAIAPEPPEAAQAAFLARFAALEAQTGGGAAAADGAARP